MKIRYYQKIDGWRWLGFILAMVSAFTLSGGNPDVQWIGWTVALISCSIWIWMGIKDKDTPRALIVRMSAWSTNPDYHEIILQAIVDNKLP